MCERAYVLEAVCVGAEEVCVGAQELCLAITESCHDPVLP